MAMGNVNGQPGDWRESKDLLQVRESAASALASVERMLMAQGMPSEYRLLLTRAERRRVVQSWTMNGGERERE